MSFDFSDLPSEEKCYLVFKGKPSPIWYDHDDAIRHAAELCEEEGDRATIMVIPRLSLEHALVAINHGVKVHALQADEDDD